VDSRGGAARNAPRRPRGSTRERILDIALELFNEQGYDKTSLREIAERLSVTKAALYYHFERKEDILLELHMRLHALGRDMLSRLGSLENAQEIASAWSELLDGVIDMVIENRDLVLLHQRNSSAFEQLEQSDHHKEEHDDLEHQLRRFLVDPRVPLRQRVRMACSIGAVFGALIGAGEAFADVTNVELAALVRESVRDLLGSKPANRPPTRRPARGGPR
jgi:AcrR family transcriptional regulator